jgi:uncharacterized protein YjbJ (UPF0337 family)
MSGTDKFKNSAESMKGEAKERLGGATGDKDLEARVRPTSPRPT